MVKAVMNPKDYFSTVLEVRRYASRRGWLSVARIVKLWIIAMKAVCLHLTQLQLGSVFRDGRQQGGAHPRLKEQLILGSIYGPSVRYSVLKLRGSPDAWAGLDVAFVDCPKREGWALV